VKSLPRHHAHNYTWLLRQWRNLAGESGLRLRVLCRVNDLPVIWLESQRAGQGEAANYVSAGVHGDEPGATLGLLNWALARQKVLAEGSWILFPCLNPHGLIRNERMDGRGMDLNRRFQLDDDPTGGPWRRMMLGRRLRMGICLHEDYDGQGCYLYELRKQGAGWGKALLDRCSTVKIPRDCRSMIDGRRAQDGVIQRRYPPRGLPGLPEAIVLYEMGCPVSLTFETPSEFALDDRVRAHVRFLDAALAIQKQNDEFTID